MKKYIKGDKINKLNQLGPDKILKLYQEHGDLTKAAKYLMLENGKITVNHLSS